MAVQYHLSLLVFFIGLLLTAANKCPEPDEIDPCQCWPNNEGPPRTTCENIDNVEVLKRVFSGSGDRPFLDLQVSGSVLSYFPADALKEKGVRDLSLERSHLVGLFDRVPEPNHKLKEIHILESKIFRGMEWPLLRNLNNLTRLQIGGVTIRSLGKEFMDNVPRSLESLTVLSSKLSRLNDQVFSRLTAMTDIILWNGKISTLKRSMFPAVNVIETLDFSQNRISELPDGIFSDMPKLEKLGLENNLLTTISETIFNEIGGRNVEMMLLGNNIKCDCKIRWAMKKGWTKLEAQCHSPLNLQNKAVVGGLSDDDMSYCDDVRR